MRLRTALLALALAALAFSTVAAAKIVAPSKYRDTSDPFLGNMIFGERLPFNKEAEWKGLATEFTWGEFDHLECRIFFPRTIGEIQQDLLDQVSAKGILYNPYVKYNFLEMWIDPVGPDGKPGKPIAYGLCRFETRHPQWDQQLVWIYDSEDREDGCELDAKPGTTGYDPEKPKPFPDAFVGKPGKYRCFFQYCVKIKGETGSGSWSYDEWGESWDYSPEEGYLDKMIARGEFYITVP